jgi:hypothetical protein
MGSRTSAGRETSPLAAGWSDGAGAATDGSPAEPWLAPPPLAVHAARRIVAAPRRRRRRRRRRVRDIAGCYAHRP